MSATLILTSPNAPQARTMSITSACPASFTRKVASAIRTFATQRGISPLSVDYEIVRGRRS